MTSIAIATTILTAHQNTVRETLALKTANETARYKYPFIAIYGGHRNSFVEKMENAGVLIKIESGQCEMGASRRQAMKEASRVAGKNGVVVWMEPEKYTFVPHIVGLAEVIMRKEADLVIPMRSSLNSYPKEQQESETLMNRLFERVLKKQKADLSFGPRIMNRVALSLFLDYKGEYGDKWDSIIIPVLRAVKMGLSVQYTDVPYVHPREQTREEEGTMEMFVKRIEQFCNIAPSFYVEAKKLGLV